MTPALTPIPLLRRPENWLLLAFFAALTIQSLWGVLYDVTLPERADLVDRLVLYAIVAVWVMYDSGRHGLHRPFIFGFFLFVAWPLVAPFHLWKTRRWRAFFTVVIFVVLWLISALPYVVQNFRDTAEAA